MIARTMTGLATQTGKKSCEPSFFYEYASVLNVVLSFRCQCGHCVTLRTRQECICCCEVERVVLKKEESSREISCITDHEGFESVYLDVWVLQTAYYSYRYHYGHLEEKDVHE